MKERWRWKRLSSREFPQEVGRFDFRVQRLRGFEHKETYGKTWEAEVGTETLVLGKLVLSDGTHRQRRRELRLFAEVPDACRSLLVEGVFLRPVSPGHCQDYPYPYALGYRFEDVNSGHGLWKAVRHKIRRRSLDKSVCSGRDDGVWRPR